MISWNVCLIWVHKTSRAAKYILMLLKYLLLYVVCKHKLNGNLAGHDGCNGNSTGAWNTAHTAPIKLIFVVTWYYNMCEAVTFSIKTRTLSYNLLHYLQKVITLCAHHFYDIISRLCCQLLLNFYYIMQLLHYLFPQGLFRPIETTPNI